MIFNAECFPNGTITAWALKLKSVPSLDPSKLILNDPSCRPSFSDDRSAYFVFAANTCGTTRKVTRSKVSQIARKVLGRNLNHHFLCLFVLLQFVNNMMLYQNEISLPDDEDMSQKMLGEEPEYE